MYIHTNMYIYIHAHIPIHKFINFCILIYINIHIHGQQTGATGGRGGGGGSAPSSAAAALAGIGGERADGSTPMMMQHPLPAQVALYEMSVYIYVYMYIYTCLYYTSVYNIHTHSGSC